MAYWLRLLRENPIYSDEISEVVEQLDGMRVEETESGELEDKGYVEIFHAKDNKWYPFFQYREEELEDGDERICLRFKLNVEPEYDKKFAGTLAKALNANIVGEEEEHYDPDSFNVIPGTPAWKEFQTTDCRWHCECKPVMGDYCCSSFFEALKCHRIADAVKTERLSGYKITEETSFIDGTPGRQDFGLSRKSNSEAMVTTSVRAREFLTKNGITLTELRPFTLDETN